MATYYAAGGPNNNLSAWRMDAALSVAATTLPVAGDDLVFVPGSGSITHAQDAQGNWRNVSWTSNATGQYIFSASNRIMSVTGNIDCSQAAEASPFQSSTGVTAVTLQMVGTGAEQTVNMHGKVWGQTTGGLTFRVGTSTISPVVTLTGDLYLNSVQSGTRNIDVLRGTFNTGGFTVNAFVFICTSANVRSLNFGTSTLTFHGTGTAWNVSSTNITASLSQSTIIFAGNNAGMGAGNLAYGTVQSTGAGAFSLSGIGCSFVNFSRVASGAGAQLVLQSSTGIQASGSVTLGTTAERTRLDVVTTTIGTAWPIRSDGPLSLGPDVSFRDIVMQGAGWSAYEGTGDALRTGDALGNTGAPVGFFAISRLLYGVAGGLTSSPSVYALTADGATGVGPPLPQDDLILTTASRLTSNTPNLCRDLTVAAVGIGHLYFNAPADTTTIYGSLTLSSDIAESISAPSTARALVLAGRGTHTVTSNGRSLGTGINFYGPGATFDLVDALSVAGPLSISNGTLNTNDQGVTCSIVGPTSIVGFRALNGGTSTFTLTGTGAIWNTNDGFTLGMSAATVEVADTSGAVKIVANERGANAKFGRLRYVVNGGPLQLGGTNSRGYHYGVLEVSGTSDQGAPKRVVFSPNASTLSVDSWEIGSPESYVYLQASGSTQNVTSPPGTAIPYMHVDGVEVAPNSIVVGGAVRASSVNITSLQTDWPQVLDAQSVGNTTATTVRALTPATAVQNGDVIVLTGFADTTTAPTPPVGFVEIGAVLTNGGLPALRAYAKTITDAASEPASFGLTYPTAVIHTAALTLVRGSIGVDASGSAGAYGTGNNSNTYVSPSASTTRPRSVVLRQVGVISGDRPASSSGGGFTLAGGNVGSSGNALVTVLSYSPTAGLAPVEHGTYTNSSTNDVISLAINSTVVAEVLSQFPWLGIGTNRTWLGLNVDVWSGLQ